MTSSPVEKPVRQGRSVLSGLLVIIGAVAITFFALAIVFNTRCSTMFRDSIFIYPNAEMISEAYPFLSRQLVQYYTPDTPDTVQAWFQQAQAQRMREAVVSGNQIEMGSDSLELPLIELAQDRGGSLITWSHVCP